MGSEIKQSLLYREFYQSWFISDCISLNILVAISQSLSLSLSLSLLSLPFIYIYIYIYTHTHTHIYIYTHHIYIYIYISTTLSRRLTMHLSDTSSIAQHLKKHSCPTTQLRKILTDNTTILEHQNNKQKLQILEALYIRNLQPALNRINFQTSANVLKCLYLLALFTELHLKANAIISNSKDVLTQ